MIRSFIYALASVLILAAVPAVAKDDAARKSYMRQVCEHSTAAIVKQALLMDGQSVDDFCSCVSDLAVKKTRQKDDHVFALAYHEVNIVTNRTLRYGSSQEELATALWARSKDYDADYGISYEALSKKIKPAQKALTQCKLSTAKNPATTGLRGFSPVP